MGLRFVGGENGKVVVVRRIERDGTTGGEEIESIPIESMEEAAARAREWFGLALPDPSSFVVEPPPPARRRPAFGSSSSSSSFVGGGRTVGFLATLFARRRVGPNGELMFKDHGSWGTYEGDVDVDGNRVGGGRMTYVDGSYYEGNFVNDKFHGDNGVYRWPDGDEYVGQWKDGERHGVGIFRSAADGGMTYSMYEAGAARGCGVGFDAGRKTAHETLDGNKTTDISIVVAELLVKEKFDVPT